MAEQAFGWFLERGIAAGDARRPGRVPRAAARLPHARRRPSARCAIPSSCCARCPMLARVLAAAARSRRSSPCPAKTALARIGASQPDVPARALRRGAPPPAPRTAALAAVAERVQLGMPLHADHERMRAPTRPPRSRRPRSTPRRGARLRDGRPPGGAPTAPTSSRAVEQAREAAGRIDRTACWHRLQLRRAVHDRIAELVGDVRDRGRRRARRSGAACRGRRRGPAVPGRDSAARASASSKRRAPGEMP